MDQAKGQLVEQHLTLLIRFLAVAGLYVRARLQHRYLTDKGIRSSAASKRKDATVWFGGAPQGLLHDVEQLEVRDALSFTAYFRLQRITSSSMQAHESKHAPQSCCRLQQGSMESCWCR